MHNLKLRINNAIYMNISSKINQSIQFRIDCFAMDYSVIIAADKITNKINETFDKYILLETMYFLTDAYYNTNIKRQ